MGAIIRDSEGRVIAARCLAMHGCLDPLSAEAWAGTQAISFCAELGLSNIYLEGDAMGVIEAVKAEGQNWSKIEHLVEDMKLLLQELSPWQIHGVGRMANCAAHTLARCAVREGLDMTWMEAFPACIRAIILRECSTPCSQID